MRLKSMEVIHDYEKKKFHIGKDNIIAEMTYIRSGTNIIIEHTLVDSKHRGEGLGTILLDGVADFARKSELILLYHIDFKGNILPNAYWHKRCVKHR